MLRSKLAEILNRPTLREEEMYYSVSFPGASLKRHLDERHEELKGRRGWLAESRRSLSWLIYLSDGEKWDVAQQGGQLRSFPPKRRVASCTRLGGRNIHFQSVGASEGDLQVAWLLVPGVTDDEVQPVFMDCWRPNQRVALYLAGAEPLLKEEKEELTENTSSSYEDRRLYITEDFDLVCPTSASRVEDWSRFLLPSIRGDIIHQGGASKGSIGELLMKIEEPDLWARGDDPAGSEVVDIAPTRATLVVFDSVRIPSCIAIVSIFYIFIFYLYLYLNI
jgi:hypothetical protein